ncbi:hypothetical protein PS1_008320 [Malus domestica]
MIEFQLNDFVQPTYENAMTEAARSSSQTGNQLIKCQANVKRRLLPPRTRKSAIPDDYLVYLQKMEINEDIIDDPMTFDHVMQYEQSQLWKNAMLEDMNSMQVNGV